ncbi:MAG: hypothetical protein EPO62_02785 [Candidatus Nitrosotenuis sp.]|nr:MAG: hypothetical protein EPO62_02785 [Candidatus Nitrosotenuis sp.]
MIEQIVADNSTWILLSVAAVVFSYLAIKSKSFKSFQFQISAFVILWIVGEAVGIIQEENVVYLGNENVGMQIHLASMILLSCILWLRYYTSKKSNKKMIERSEDYDN